MKGVITMKKLLSVILILALCLTSAALAEAVPSKTTQDVIRARVEAVAENGASFYFIIHDTNVSDDQLARLLVAANLDTYFGNITKEDGERARLVELLGSENVNVFEFAGVDVAGYQTSFGPVRVKARFVTQYDKTDKVFALVGIPGRSLAWSVYECTVIDDQGTLEFVLPAQIVAQIQQWTGLIAIASSQVR